MSQQALAWILFNLMVFGMLALDLGVFHRKAHVVGFREALGWSAVWIALAMCFNLGLYFWKGKEVALQFFTGYLIEKSLSVDNIFVFIMIFSYFRVPPIYQHKVLFWGILGALIMRAILIGLGTALISRFHWVIYVFGAFLVFTGVKMALAGDEEIDPEKNPLVRLLRRFVPVSSSYHEDKFVVRSDQRWMATPLLLVLAIVEMTDLVFALDSIPAIFGITTDAFIVYTSNIFAILGLRALYFALAGVMGMFHFLKLGLAVVLVFVGVKMIIAEFYKIPIGIALGTIVGILAISIIASLLFPQKKTAENMASKPAD